MKNKEQYPKKWITKEIKSLRPTRNKNGAILYKDALQYIVRVMEQDSPMFSLVLGLASFATSNKLSFKQKEKANEIINFYEDRGYFND